MVKVEDLKLPAGLFGKASARLFYLLPGGLARAGEVQRVAVEMERSLAGEAQAGGQETACRFDQRLLMHIPVQVHAPATLLAERGQLLRVALPRHIGKVEVQPE